MAEHKKKARPSTWNKHSNRDKHISKQKKTESGRYSKGGSPKGRHNR